MAEITNPKPEQSGGDWSILGGQFEPAGEIDYKRISQAQNVAASMPPEASVRFMTSQLITYAFELSHQPEIALDPELPKRVEFNVAKYIMKSSDRTVSELREMIKPAIAELPIAQALDKILAGAAISGEALQLRARAILSQVVAGEDQDKAVNLD